MAATATDDQPDLKTILTTRGETFSPAEALILKTQYPGKKIPQDDDASELPQLEHLPDLTYKRDQYALVQEELAERRRPKIQLQPLFTQNVVPKALNDQVLYPNNCLPDLDEFEFEAPQCVAAQDIVEQTKYYQKIEEEQQVNPPKRSLVYHKLVQPPGKQFYAQRGTYKDTLRFEGRYEGGNLYQVVQQYKDPVYEIYISPDAFTAFHCLYFNFQVANFQPGITYTFKIMNLSKMVPAIQPFFVLNGRIMLLGEKMSTYRSNQRQKTILFYNHVNRPEDFRNVEEVTQEDQYTSALKAYRNFQKKAGFTKKMISKKLCSEELNFNMYRFVFQFTVPPEAMGGYDPYDPHRPLIPMQISNTLPFSYKNTLLYCQKLANTQFAPEDDVVMEVRQLCRSYLGNSIPVIKIFAKSDAFKDIILIISRTGPDDSNSQLISQGFVSQLLGRLDYYYLDELEQYREANPVLYQNLLQKYQQETAARKQILSQFVFYIIPVFDIDGQVMGQHRVNFFNQDFGRSFGLPGGFKNPQIQFVNTLVAYCKETGIKINRVFDLKTSGKVDGLVFNCNQQKSYKDLNMKLWEILGQHGIVPVAKVASQPNENETPQQMGQKQTQIKYFDDVRTAEGFQRVETFFDEALNQEPKIGIARELRGQILEYCREQNCFAEFAEFSQIRKEFGLFSFADSTFTVAPPAKQNTARSFFFHSCGAGSYQVVAPRAYSSEQYRRCGREVCRFVQFRFMQDGELYREQVEHLQADYADSLKSAVLSAFTNGQLKFIDRSKYTPAQLGKLPAQLKMLSQLEDAKYANFRELNDRTCVRSCLRVSEAADTVSDSDDSEVDMEAASGKPKKVSPEEKKIQQEKRNFIRQIMTDAYPEMQPKKKAKKGKKGKK